MLRIMVELVVYVADIEEDNLKLLKKSYYLHLFIKSRKLYYNISFRLNYIELF